MEFRNEQINTEGLPDFTAIQTEKLSKDYLKVIYIVRGMVSLVFIAGIVVGAFLLKDIPQIARMIIAAILILMLIYYFSMSRRVFNARSYAIRQKDILYTRGLIFRSITIIPFNRIQHIEIVSGPVDRMFHLASLKIFTAGGTQSDLSISGLPYNDASKIKSFIISKTATDEEE